MQNHDQHKADDFARTQMLVRDEIRLRDERMGMFEAIRAIARQMQYGFSVEKRRMFGATAGTASEEINLLALRVIEDRKRHCKAIKSILDITGEVPYADEAICSDTHLARLDEALSARWPHCPNRQNSDSENDEHADRKLLAKLPEAAAPPIKLLPHHRQHLRLSGLTDETIDAAGLYSETDPKKSAAMLGWRRPSKCLAPCIVFPFTGTDGHNGYARIRPDTPRKSKGRAVKYESPRGQPNRVYFPPGVAKLLDDPAGELLLTEGEKKAPAATQAGFSCLGLVGVYGWKDKGQERLIVELERINWTGRKVFIAFDSDISRKSDVQLAESKLAKHLADRGAVVRCVRQSDGPADADGKPKKMGLDDSLVANGPAEFRKLLDAAVDPEPLQGAEGKECADKIEPATFGAAFLGEYESDGLPHLRFWRGGFHLWHGGRYIEIEPSEAQADLVRSINRGYSYLTTGIIGNVMAQVRAQSALPSRTEPPTWLDAPAVDWLASEVLATRRELIHIPSLVTGQKYSIPATPRFFSTVALDYGFAIDAPEPRLWLRFLRELWEDDAESIATLQEMFGYALTPDTRHQKIFMLIGPPRSGKGTITRVLNRIVGPANVAGPTLASLETNFGLSPLLGKSLAIIADARLSGKVDQSKVVERLLSISGEDSLTADRKYREPVTGKIPARIVIVSNELPRLAESSGALANRMIVLRLTKTFLGREDTALTDKLVGKPPSIHGEMAGILLWGIEGWRRLRERGRFIQPEAGKELAGEMKDLSSPVGMFLRERCRIGSQYSAAVDAVYGDWCDWCKTNGRDHPGTKQTLGRDLRAAVPTLRDSQPREGETRYRAYEGIGLLE